MSKNELKALDKKALGDIILCDPITTKGIQSLQSLGLVMEITEEFFFECLCVKPKYGESVYFKSSNNDPIFHHEYSESKELFNEKKKLLKEFCKKFTDSTINHSPLLILGTAGNGKTIEINAKIRNPCDANDNRITSSKIVYDFERGITETSPHGGLMYRLNAQQRKDSLWVVCITLLEELFCLAERSYAQKDRVFDNYRRHFIEKNTFEDSIKKLFEKIEACNPNDNTCKDLFQAMKDLIVEEDVELTLETLLKSTLQLMYCVDPSNKNYIVFDNLEEHITVDGAKIPIPNKALQALDELTVKVMKNIERTYNKICDLEAWRAFKIILVLRRTSAHFLLRQNQHYVTLSTSNDYSGHFDIWDIWDKKKEHVWDKYLVNRYDEHASKIVAILEDMMEDRPNHRVLGQNYQERIAQLMNSSIRRNGRAQAHTAEKIYDLLSENNKCYIDFGTYQILRGNAHESRYLYRAALLEIQHKRMIASAGSRERFKKLLLGELAPNNPLQWPSKDCSGQPITTQRIVLKNTNKSYTTFVRRILSYLSHFREPENNQSPGMYRTQSLYDLMSCFFIDPSGNKIATEDIEASYLPLAKVLNALGNVDHSETKTAPFVVIYNDDIRNPTADPDIELSMLLKSIWEAGPEESRDGAKYERAAYGVRLTEAGAMFLYDVQPGFSFFAALYCIDEKPLFYCKDIERIKFVIDTVYKEAEKLCRQYENAAHAFCRTQSLAKPGSKYLPEKGSLITFKKRVKDMHSNHLRLYYDFIDNYAATLSMDVRNKLDLLRFVSMVKDKYDNWEINKNCF